MFDQLLYLIQLLHNRITELEYYHEVAGSTNEKREHFIKEFKEISLQFDQSLKNIRESYDSMNRLIEEQQKEREQRKEVSDEV